MGFIIEPLLGGGGGGGHFIERVLFSSIKRQVRRASLRKSARKTNSHTLLTDTILILLSSNVLHGLVIF